MLLHALCVCNRGRSVCATEGAARAVLPSLSSATGRRSAARLTEAMARVSGRDLPAAVPKANFKRSNIKSRLKPAAKKLKEKAAKCGK